MSNLYFAYGSNMSRQRLAERISGVRARGPAWIEDRRLEFNKPGRDGTGKANLVEQRGSHAWGVVYELDDAAWEVLDGFEGGYERCLVDVHSGWNATVVQRSNGAPRFGVQTYLWPGDGPIITPASWYVEHVRSGAVEHRLPAAYLRVIESFAGLAE